MERKRRTEVYGGGKSVIERKKERKKERKSDNGTKEEN